MSTEQIVGALDTVIRDLHLSLQLEGDHIERVVQYRIIDMLERFRRELEAWL